MIIVFEGLDKSGKTTGLNIANQYLKEHYNEDTEVISEVGSNSTGLGSMIKDILSKISLDDTTQFYLISAVRSYMKNELEKLNKTKIILMDRYYISTQVYQSNVFKYLNRPRPFVIKSLYDEIILNTTLPIDGLMYFESSIDTIKQRLDNTRNLDNLEYKIKKDVSRYFMLYNYFIHKLPTHLPIVKINTDPGKSNVRQLVLDGIDTIMRNRYIRS